ncbi:hypothetical protein OIU76_011386 [Salix suchowensis]|nr:hypothetical protein OIU76_011386 [Salix suchowensis]
MSSKRLHIVRSLNQGETGMFNEVLPIEPPPDRYSKRKCRVLNHGLKVSALEEKIKPLITDFLCSLLSRLRERKDAQQYKMKKPIEGSREFLKTCFFCKKKLNVYV